MSDHVYTTPDQLLRSEQPHVRPTSLYLAFDEGLLYVGITENRGIRSTEHRKTAKWWFLMERMEYRHYATKADAHAAERWYIEHWRPEHNQHGKTSCHATTYGAASFCECEEPPSLDTFFADFPFTVDLELADRIASGESSPDETWAAFSMLPAVTRELRDRNAAWWQAHRAPAPEQAAA